MPPLEATENASDITRAAGSINSKWGRKLDETDERQVQGNSAQIRGQVLSRACDSYVSFNPTPRAIQILTYSNAARTGLYTFAKVEHATYATGQSRLRCTKCQPWQLASRPLILLAKPP
jgi:hypothetical protein